MRDSTLTKLVVATVALTVVGSAVVVGGAVSLQTEETSQDTSYLRVAHVSPDAPAVDVTLGNETVLSDVEFGDVSDYLTVTAGTANVSITTADPTEATVFEGELELDARTATTLYASGETNEEANTSFEPVAIADDAFTPGPDEAALSVVHMSPDAPAVDVVVTEAPGDDETATPTAVAETETPVETTEADDDTFGVPNETETETAGDGEVVLADDLEFQNATDYVNVPAGDYTVEIRVATEDNDGEAVATVDLSVEGGQAYSAIAAGYVNVDAAPPEGEAFTVIPVEDATKTVTLPGEEVPTPVPTTPAVTEAPNETDTPEETLNETDTPNETEAPGTDTGTPEESPTGTETPGETDTPGETPAGTDTVTPEGTPGTPTPTGTPV
jgi:hypothetical protein